METTLIWLPIALLFIGLYLIHQLIFGEWLSRMAEKLMAAKVPTMAINIACWSLLLIAAGCVLSPALVPAFFGPPEVTAGMTVNWQGKEGIVVSQPGFWGSGGYEIRLVDNTVVKVARKEMTIKKTND